MKLHTLPDVLFPNPRKHPNYKLECLSKVKEDIFNLQYNVSRLPTRQTVRSFKRTSQHTSQTFNNTQSHFRSASFKMRIIREHSYIEEMDETFSRTRTPLLKMKRGLSLIDK